MAVTLAAVLAATPVGRARQQTPADGRQVFRASTDAVTVDVSVRAGGARVGGLAAEDFALLDNGVPQRIDTVESSVVPVDVTILVDTDDEVAELTDDVNEQAARIASMLRPTDRLRVWNIDTDVSEVMPLQVAGPHPSLPRMMGGGLAAVYDAIGAVLMEPVAADARHLVIAVTNGIDTDSVLSLATVRDIAARANATLHVSQIDVVESAGTWVTSREDLRGYQCSRTFECEPTHRFWQPHYEPQPGPERFAPLTQLAQATGGDVHTLGLFVEHNAADVFANVFRDYQENYVLRYTPQGVTREGWHTIAVTVPAYPAYAIHARRGYAIEGEGAPAPTSSKDTPPSPPAPRATAPEALSTVDKLIRAYERGDYVATFDAARQWTDAARLIDDVRAAGDLWPASPHREAVLALELAQAGLFGDSGDGKQAAEQWLAEEGRLLRPPLGPDAFEHDWLAAELALLEAIGNPASVQPFVASALQRFPDDPEFLLAGAIVADQRWPLGNENVMTAAEAARQVANVTASYDAVIAHPEAPDAVAEARVRQAYLLHRLNRDAQALSQLDAVRDADADPAVRFLRDLFRGHVLIALGRTAEALDAYRAAVAILPGAQSARVALMNALVASGDRPGALALSESIQATPASDADPWHLYWPGDYRRFPQELGRLRALVR